MCPIVFLYIPIHLVTHNDHNSSDGNCPCSVISATLDFPEMPFAAKSYDLIFWNPGHDNLPSETMFIVGRRSLTTGILEQQIVNKEICQLACFRKQIRFY